MPHRAGQPQMRRIPLRTRHSRALATMRPKLHAWTFSPSVRLVKSYISFRLKARAAPGHLSEHALTPHRFQFIVGPAQPRAIDSAIIGSERMTRLQGLAVLSLEAQRRVRQRDAAERRVIDPLQAAARQHVLVARYLGEVTHRRAG